MSRHFCLVLLAAAACGSSPRPAAAPAAVPASPTVEPAAALAPAPTALRLPDAVVPTAYRLRLEVDPAREGFQGHVDIDVRIAAATDQLWLHAHALAITAPAITAGGKRQAMTAGKPGHDAVGFSFARVPAGDATLHFDFAGKAPVDAMEGLFREQDGERWYMYTQLESVFARKVFPSFDEPRFKVPWQVTLVVPKGQVALSNMPATGEIERPDGRVEIAFAPTPPLPSYLVAIAVGPFELVDIGTVGRNKVPARIAALAGKANETAAAREVTPKLVAALEAYFDMPLPYPKLDQVVVPRFFGAMENPGLITYAASILTAAPGSDHEGFRRQLIAIAGHELAHQWFGDLVTLAWWDDTWLNESFATWMADRAGEAIDARWDTAIRNVEEAETAMRADVSASARPLHRTVESTADIAGAFDAIAYEKGGAVLSMFERWIGRERFRDGVRAYLAKHANATATSADFLAALTAVSTPEVSRAFHAFLDKPGVPLVRARLACDGAPRLELSQQRLMPADTKADGADATPWPIPVCARYPGKGGAVERCQLVDASSATFALEGKACPAWVVVNAGAAGYYRVAHDDALRGKLLKALPRLSPAERMAMAGDTQALYRLGHVEIGVALELARALLAGRDQHDVLAATAILAGTEDLVDDAHRASWQRYLRAALGPRARKAGLVPPAGATPAMRSAHRALVKVVAVLAEDPALLAAARAHAERWLAGTVTIPVEDLTSLLIAAAAGGDAALFDRFEQKLAASKDRHERSALLFALGSFPSPPLVERALALMVSKAIGYDELGPLASGLFSRPPQQALVWARVRDQFDAILEKVPPFARGYTPYLASGFCTAALRAEVDAFFRPRISAWANGDQVLAKSLETIDRCVQRRARSAAAIDRWFPLTP